MGVLRNLCVLSVEGRQRATAEFTDAGGRVASRLDSANLLPLWKLPSLAVPAGWERTGMLPPSQRGEAREDSQLLPRGGHTPTTTPAPAALPDADNPLRRARARARDGWSCWAGWRVDARAGLGHRVIAGLHALMEEEDLGGSWCRDWELGWGRKGINTWGFHVGC